MKLKIKTTKFIIIVMVALVVSGILFLVLKRDSGGLDDTGLTTINYSPPTEEERKAGNEQKQANEDRNRQIEEQNQNHTDKKQVKPFLSYWGQDSDSRSIEVNGYITGIYEDGGTCTLTARKDQQEVTTSRKAIKDAKTTTCGLLEIARDKLTPGNWSVAVTYNSSTATGTSDTVNVEVK